MKNNNLITLQPISPIDCAKEFGISIEMVYKLVRQKKLNTIPLHKTVITILKDDLYKAKLDYYKHKQKINN